MHLNYKKPYIPGPVKMVYTAFQNPTFTYQFNMSI